MTVRGKLVPLDKKVFVTGMEFGESVTKTGIVLPSDDGKGTGIHPRWGKVFAVGPNQKDVSVGEWVLVEHGRWTRGIKYEGDDGVEITIHMVDNEGILLVSDEPDDVIRSAAFGAGSNVNFNIPGA